MGTSGWDEESWGRGHGSRNGRIDDDERGSGRLYDRSSRGGAASARSYEGSRRGGSSGGWERSRDDGRSSSGSRSGRRGSGELDDGRGRGGPNSSPGWDRPGSGSLGNGRRPPREDYDGRGGERSMRGPRPQRDETWEPGSRGHGGMAGGSSGRNRAPRGGLWDDQDASPRRRRPDAGDPRARGPRGQRGPRDVGALRRGLVNMDEEPEEKKSSFTAGKAILVVLLMFVIGAGAGYAYFKLSKPVVHGDAPVSSTPATTPSASPSSTASPSSSATPTSLAPSGTGVVSVVVTGGGRINV